MNLRGVDASKDGDAAKVCQLKLLHRMRDLVNLVGEPYTMRRPSRMVNVILSLFRILRDQMMEQKTPKMHISVTPSTMATATHRHT